VNLQVLRPTGQGQHGYFPWRMFSHDEVVSDLGFPSYSGLLLQRKGKSSASSFKLQMSRRYFSSSPHHDQQWVKRRHSGADVLLKHTKTLFPCFSSR
jgi:hypothetical protein